jgi:hypothetical protein
MNYFDFLETKFVETQKKVQVKPEEVRVEDQAKVNAVTANIQLGRKTVQFLYQMYLLTYFVAIKLRLRKAPTHLSSIPPKPATPPDLKVVDNGPPKSA